MSYYPAPPVTPGGTTFSSYQPAHDNALAVTGGPTATLIVAGVALIIIGAQAIIGARWASRGSG